MEIDYNIPSLEELNGVDYVMHYAYKPIGQIEEDVAMQEMKVANAKGLVVIKHQNEKQSIIKAYVDIDKDVRAELIILAKKKHLQAMWNAAHQSAKLLYRSSNQI